MDQKDAKQQKQKTPKGYEIPIPKRSDFARLVKKAAQPLGPRGAKKKSSE
jgi:hypothetical protein